MPVKAQMNANYRKNERLIEDGAVTGGVSESEMTAAIATAVATCEEYTDDAVAGVGVTVDSTLDSSSENPVQNKTIYNALADKADTSDLPSSTELVPDTSGASSGDVLTFDGTDVEWSTPSSGGLTKHTYSTIGAFVADVIANPDGIMSYKDPDGAGAQFFVYSISTSSINVVGFRNSVSTNVYPSNTLNLNIPIVSGSIYASSSATSAYLYSNSSKAIAFTTDGSAVTVAVSNLSGGYNMYVSGIEYWY